MKKSLCIVLAVIAACSAGAFRLNADHTIRIPVPEEVKPGQVVCRSIDFLALEAQNGEMYSRDVLTLTDRAGRAAAFHFKLLTPGRGEIRWIARSPEYLLTLAPATAAAGEEPAAILGDGGQLSFNEVRNLTMPFTLWNAVFADLFQTGRPALVAGFWPDYAHIFENTAEAGEFRFSNRRHYLARDSKGNPVGTRPDHPGLAFSLAFPVDFDGDGKIDLFLRRQYDSGTQFLRNVSADPRELKFADPVKLPFPLFRAAWGDVDGDGTADMVELKPSELPSGGSRVALFFRKGRGLGADGVPVFDPPTPLPVAIPDGTVRLGPENRPSVSLRDLTGDGRCDLTVVLPPDIYVCFNRSQGDKVEFSAPRQVLADNGKPLASGMDFPAADWCDLNEDGIPDLVLVRALRYHPARNSELEVAATPIYPAWLETRLELRDMIGILDNFAVDGNRILHQIHNRQLQTIAVGDGVLGKPSWHEIYKPDAQRYGCPDPWEYHALYSQIKLHDMDGDGLEDIVINDEHTWRFGYLGYCRNLGNRRYAEEVRLYPGGGRSHLEMRDGALRTGAKTMLDYLSFDCGEYPAEGKGRIEFEFARGAESGGQPEALLSSVYYDYFKIAKALQWRRYDNIYLKGYDFRRLFAVTRPFVLMLLPDNRLYCRLNDVEKESAALDFVPGKFCRIVVEYDPAKGTEVSVNGAVAASFPGKVPVFADRMHIGSYAWNGMQREREYRDRWKDHPNDYSFPAEGYFRNFRMNGKDPLAPDATVRSRIGYRNTPEFLRYRGGEALAMPLGNSIREIRPEVPSVLNIIPFRAAAGKAPEFLEPVPLELTDGRPFSVNNRTQVTATDWNGDGHPDFILSSENHPNPYTVGVELFLNDGNWRFTRTADPVIAALNREIAAHHDVKLSLISLTGEEEPDFVVRTDSGTRVFSRNYLRNGVYRIPSE